MFWIPLDLTKCGLVQFYGLILARTFSDSMIFAN